MSSIKDIFRTYGQEYLKLYEDKIPKNHKKVITAISECRSGYWGTIVYHCEDCH